MCSHMLRGFEVQKNIPEILEYEAIGRPTQIYLVNKGNINLDDRMGAIYSVRCSELLPIPNPNGVKCWSGNDVLIYFSPGKALSHQFPRPAASRVAMFR
jgi:hypothetical protein